MTREERIAELEAELAELKSQKPFKPYLAWVSDRPEYCSSIDLIEDWDDGRFLGKNEEWKYATPLTRQEVLDLLPAPTSKYDWDVILRVYPWATAVGLHPDGKIVICDSQKLIPRTSGFNGNFNECEALVKPEWILHKTDDWKDSIEYKRDVF